MFKKRCPTAKPKPKAQNIPWCWWCVENFAEIKKNNSQSAPSDKKYVFDIDGGELGRVVEQENNELFDVELRKKISDILHVLGEESFSGPKSADLLFALTFMIHLRFRMMLMVWARMCNEPKKKIAENSLVTRKMGKSLRKDIS